MKSTIVLLLCVVMTTTVRATILKIGIGDQSHEAVRLENGRLKGGIAEAYQCAFENLEFTVKYSVLPQARILHMLKTGEIDVGIPLVRMPDRDEYAVFTHPVVLVPYHLYTTREINLADDLSTYTFTVMRSSARGSQDFLSRNPNFEEVTSWEQALTLARIGRFDGAVIPAPVIENLPAKSFEGLKKHDFGVIPASMYVSRQINNSNEIVRRLDALIKNCLAPKK